MSSAVLLGKTKRLDFERVFRIHPQNKTTNLTNEGKKIRKIIFYGGDTSAGKLRRLCRNCCVGNLARVDASGLATRVFLHLQAVAGDLYDNNVSLLTSSLRLMRSAVSTSMFAADLSQLTAIICTANRPKSLRRLVQSLRQQLPAVKILIADLSCEPRVPKQADLIKVSSGVGRAAGCNALLARVRTPYFLMIDDRAELTVETQVERLLELVVEDKLDLAAGDFMGCQRKLWFFVKRQPQPNHGLLEFAGDQLTLLPGHRTIGEGYAWCDLVHNFFVARTSKVRNLGGWDPELENDEREEFFVRAHRQGVRVGLAPEVVASLWNEPVEIEESNVDRKSLAVAKMGLVRMTDFDGRTVKAPRRAMAA